MLRNYIKIAFRTLLRHKAFSFINIMGLAIAMACCIVIFSSIRFELSFDRQHKNADQIHHVYLKGITDDNTWHQMTVSPVIAHILKEQFPEVENAARFGFVGETVLRSGDNMFIENGGIAADQSLFDIMTYPFIKGDPKSAYLDRHSIILTESIADKYFGKQDPMGQTLVMDNKHSFVVRGIINDVSLNEHRRFDFVIPFSFLKERGEQIESTNPFFPSSYVTFIKLRKDVDLVSLNQKIAEQLRGDLTNITLEICLVPLLDIHNLETNMNSKNLILSFIGFFILCLACVNFVNQSTALATTRSREIGVRKVAGAFRISLVKRFLGESIIIALLAGILAVGLAELMLSRYNSLSANHIPMPITNISFLAGLVFIVLLTGLMAGLYPAFYLASFHPIQILKGRNLKRSGKNTLRKSLIVFQFCITIILILGTIVVTKQNQFIFDFDQGFTKQNILYISSKGELQKHYQVIRQEILNLSGVEQVASASDLPNRIYTDMYASWGIRDGINRQIYITDVDYDYLNMFDMTMLSGRFYSKERPSDLTNAIIVNEAALQEVGPDDWVGKSFPYQNQDYTLIGVVKNFHHKSPVHKAPKPVVFRLKPENNNYLFVRLSSQLDPTGMSAAIDRIKKICQPYSPDRPLQYDLLSENKTDNERELELSNQLLRWIAFLAILISCLGLVGLSSFLNKQRTKEIGVRKVIGASLANILVLLTKDFTKWVLLSNLVAWPIAWYAMNKWLENFAYRIEMSWWMFALAGGLALVIALATVGWQAVRAATANPVKALRYE